jgi:hypothetical protein
MGMLAAAMTAPSPVPGASLDLLPDAPLPPEFSWAAAEPSVAAALARAAAAIDEAAADPGGGPAVPEPVRDLVRGRLRSWDGTGQGPSRSWADDAVGVLPATDRPAGRLALLAAFAPYQVTKNDVQAMRPAGDAALVAVASWASMAAARAIGSWL